MASLKIEHEERVLQGPYSLFDGSFILEFLEPHPSRRATVMMRATYKAFHPLNATGKAHPQSPPLHLHFEQSESFQVLSGAVGTTKGYDLQDEISTPENTRTPREIRPNVPHSFWPVADMTEDAVFLVWAHPDGGDADMDKVFFGNLLRYLSAVYEKKASLNLLRLMLMQDETASTMLLFPTASWLGPLRWWIPWKLQSFIAAIARWTGTEAIMEEYTEKDDWERIQNAKRKVL